jgi:hypothetical protein
MSMFYQEGYYVDDDVDRRSSIVASSSKTIFFLFLYLGRVGAGRESTQCQRMTMPTEKRGRQKKGPANLNHD